MLNKKNFKKEICAKRDFVPINKTLVAFLVTRYFKSIYPSVLCVIKDTPVGAL